MEIKTVGFFLRPKKIELKEVFFKFKKIFNNKNIKVLIHKTSADMLNEPEILGSECEEICNKSDVLISIGGDGTFLSTVRKSYKYNKPVLGINAGNLGFLVDITIPDFEKFIDDLLDGNFKLETRSILKLKIKKSVECEIEKNQNFQEIETFGFNDIVIHGENKLRMVDIDVYSKDGFLNNYKGDGLIIASPTGSTAYNLASGGPILYPMIDGFVITPISPHSLTQRPLILPSEFSISVEVKGQNGYVILDGQEDYEFSKYQKLYISISKTPVSIVRELNYNYFDILRKKLKWGK